jgi:hypothetical protein
MNYKIHGNTVPTFTCTYFLGSRRPLSGRAIDPRAAAFRHSELDLERLRLAVVEALGPDDDPLPKSISAPLPPTGPSAVSRAPLSPGRCRCPSDCNCHHTCLAPYTP